MMVQKPAFNGVVKFLPRISLACGLMFSSLMMTVVLNAPLYAQENNLDSATPALEKQNSGQSLTVPNTVASTEPITAKVTYQDNTYRIGPGDVLSYHVYRSDDLSQESILVRTDGMASFKGVGEVSVQGKTLPEIETILKEHLSQLIRKPIITVSIVQTRPKFVYLTGAVLNPGMHEFSTNTAIINSTETNVQRTDFKLSNILANAGGLKTNADLGNVEIRSTDALDVIKVDLWQMLEKGDQSQDITLHSGDTVYVPELAEMAVQDENFEKLVRSTIGPKTFPIRVVGSLNTPGLVDLDGKSPYLNSAIAKGGGYTVNANRKVVAVRRRVEDGQMVTLYVDPAKYDMTLRPNDVVYVVDTGLSKVSDGASKISKIFGPFTNLAAIAFSMRYFTDVTGGNR